MKKSYIIDWINMEFRKKDEKSRKLILKKNGRVILYNIY